jgi:hypothetical protein
MARQAHIDPETYQLMLAIEATTDPAEFSAVCTALEAALARRILREAGERPSPYQMIIAGQMIASHITALLETKDLLNG